MLLLKIITLTFESMKGGFDDSSLRDFLKMHMIISVKEFFFSKNEQHYLTLVITYGPSTEIEIEPRANTKNKTDESWKDRLTEADMGLFNLLREWRGSRSKKEGVPPYILFTNMQLAVIVKSRPQSLADLQKIDGIGEGKAKKYGQDILSMTKIDGVMSTPITLTTEESNDNGTVE